MISWVHVGWCWNKIEHGEESTARPLCPLIAGVVHFAELHLALMPLDPNSSIHADAQLSEFDLGLFDLAHQLFVGRRHVVEGQDAPAESEEEVGSEANEGP